MFLLKLPIARFRILDLGIGSDIAKMCVFFKKLYRNSVIALPLWDYFDIVIYNKVSALLLVIILFVEEWSLDMQHTMYGEQQRPGSIGA